jgi:pyruvate kinase
MATELGSDATMLSGESANGDYPFITTETMATINKRAEVEFYEKLYYQKQLEDARKSTSGKRAEIANQLANTTLDGKYEYAIVLSRTGELLKTISKFRPNVAILGVCDNEKMFTAFGVWHSIYMNKVASIDDFDKDDKAISETAKFWGVKAGEKILIVRNEDIRELTVA